MIVKVAKIFQAITHWPIYLFFRMFFGDKIYGQENLRGLEAGPIIFASNHSHYLDGPIVATGLPVYEGELYPKSFFPIRFLAAREFFKWYYLLVAFYVWINGCIKIERGSGKELDVILGEAVRALKENAHVWIFPEGAINNHAENDLRRGKRGVTYLYQQTGAPIVPVGLKGSSSIFSFKTLFGKTRISLKFGTPLYLPREVSLEDGAGIVMREIKKLYESLPE